MRRLIFLLMLGSLSSGYIQAAEKPYGQHSDEELTALAADWDSLDRHQRRALLTEMKLRMAKKGERKSVIHIRTERRYGRLIRQSDGRVIRIETQVVQMRQVKPEDLEAGFGTGFEHRAARRGDVVTASDAAQPDGEPAPAESAQEPTLNEVLESLNPSFQELLFESQESLPESQESLPTQAPVPDRLPIYQASDPKH